MDLKKVRPINDRVLIKRDKVEEKSPGGIYIPTQAQEKTQTGVVLAVGPGRIDERGKRIEPQVKTDDKVLFSKYAGQDAESDHVIVREDDIIGVIG